jgi:hypothetical protein
MLSWINPSERATVQPTRSERECQVGAGEDQAKAIRKGFQHGAAWAFETVIEKLRDADKDLSEVAGDYGTLASWIERRSGSW